METTRQGKPLPPVVLLEMLEFRFGAFEAIAYAALELAGKEPEVTLPMDERTARAILEFGDDLRQANQTLGQPVEACSGRS